MPQRLLQITLFLTTLLPISAQQTAEPDLRVNLENAKVREYIRSINYSYYSGSNIAKHAVNICHEDECQTRVTLNVPQHDSQPLRLDYWNTLSPQQVESISLSNEQTEVVMPNLIPQQTYAYAFTVDDAENSGSIVSQGIVETEGNLRMMEFDHIHNVRDLGGWPTKSGERLKYGLIFRGSELRNVNHNIISGPDIKRLRHLGIMAEVDLREEIKFIDQRHDDNSALGDDAAFFYADIKDGNDILIQYPMVYKAAYEFVVNSLRQQMPVYIHCTYGADRTGMLCYLIESTCGCPMDVLYKDYELTSFSPFVDLRYKSTVDIRFFNKIGYRNDYANNTLRDQARLYLHENLGISYADMDDLEAIMLGRYVYPDKPTGMGNSAASRSVVATYNLLGQRQSDGVNKNYNSHSYNRLNIVRLSDGSAKTVLSPR